MSAVAGGSGVLAVDKGLGATSFDVVALVRRRLGVRRVGHAGTLDPAATGVLPILVGEATKLTPYLMDQDKEYVATVRFGLTTDTHDASGRVLSEVEVPQLDRRRLEEACRPFVGRIKQVPPMYSAVHHEGRRLYELARKGIEVDRAPREVVVHSIAVEEVDDASATLAIVCGKGTYVRVLASELGEALGFGGCVERLIRTRVGPFRLAEAVAWDDLTHGDAAALRARVLPPEAALARWPEVRLAPDAERVFVCGQSVVAPSLVGGHGLLRVHAADGPLLGVGEAVVGGGRVRPVRILHVDRPRTRVLPA